MFSLARTLVLSVLVSFASAANVIPSVTASTNLVPGQPFTITRTTDSSSIVSLILRKGDAANLNTVLESIATNIPNTGSYTWYPENTLPGGSDYALEILGSDGIPNYSHYFAINNAAVSAAAASTGASAMTATPISTIPENLVTDSLIS